jgi:hypothetical protein
MTTRLNFSTSHHFNFLSLGTYTHNLFYLAQAFGNIGNTMESSKYCRLTLLWQLKGGFKGDDGRMAPSVVGDWVKNCAGLADFFVGMRQYNNASLALASSERILHTTLNTEIARCKVELEEDTQSSNDAPATLKRLAGIKNRIIGWEMSAVDLQAGKSKE